MHGRKSTPTPNFLGTAEAYFVSPMGLNFQISLFMPSLGVRSPCLQPKTKQTKTLITVPKFRFPLFSWADLATLLKSDKI